MKRLIIAVFMACALIAGPVMAQNPGPEHRHEHHGHHHAHHGHHGHHRKHHEEHHQ